MGSRYPCIARFTFAINPENLGDLLRTSTETYQYRLETSLTDRIIDFRKLSGFCCSVSVAIEHRSNSLREDMHSKLLVPVILDALAVSSLTRVMDEATLCYKIVPEDEITEPTIILDNVVQLFPVQPHFPGNNA